jgi:hypothetical protein
MFLVKEMFFLIYLVFISARTNPVNKSIGEKYIISPLTNERVPADKLQEHVRYNTVDPQFKEQRDRLGFSKYKTNQLPPFQRANGTPGR